MGFVGAIIGVMVGVIVLVAVAIPVVIETIENQSLTGTTALVVGLIPVLLALGGIVLVVKLYQ